MATKTCSQCSSSADLDEEPLIYTVHATARTWERHLPTFRYLPKSASLWDLDHERQGSRYLLNSQGGPGVL
jgi:hypothetical protein